MSEEEILELFSQKDETRTTPEVAKQLGSSKPATWKRLEDLHERGLLVKHSPRGLGSLTWSLSDEGRTRIEDELVAEEA